MKCPYCNKNTISPIKKLLNKNVKCNSCGKSIHFSEFKRTLAVLAFLTANYFNTSLNTYHSMISDLIFFSLLIILFFVFMIIPIDRDN